ncbi:MAG: hypothetical protein JWO63_2588 [Frankiales bacterium]|nr:hypothetical protein [Frankiales bacterium]
MAGRRVSAGLLLLGVLCAACGCGSSGSSSTPSPSLASTTSAALGSGQAAITVGATTARLDVSCTRSAAATRAIGNEGPNAVTLTLRAATPSAVLVSHGSDGSTSIYQAVKDLRDDAGTAVGALTISSSGDVYNGVGVFVVTRIDSKGNRVKLGSTAGHAHGSFVVTCATGYAPPPS